ncbi:ATP-binding protein, partial [Promicromonospora thailandica]
MPVPRARLVGRAQELGELTTALDDARAGTHRTVVVAGEAGIGKTRLLDELAARADGATVLAGQCADSGSGPVPYAALTGLLHAAVQAVGAEALATAAGPASGALTAVAPHLFAHDGAPGADTTGADRVPEVLTDLLTALAARGPVVVVLEDLHWSDDITRATAVRLARTAPAGLLLLLTYRSDDVGRAHPLRAVMAELGRARLVTRLDLDRLGADEVREMAQDLLDTSAGAGPGTGPGTLDHDLLADLTDRSEGVPFYVEELVGFLGTDLPGTLRDILLLRYWNLSHGAQALCRVAAADGPRVAHDVLDAVLDEVQGAPAGATREETAREAVDAQVLVATETGYAFRHALVQEAVYAELLPGERRRLHAAYARTLEPTTVAGTRSVARLSRIADHWWRAGVPDRALAAAVAGHRAAAAEAASVSAVSLGERALELWEQVPDAEDVAGLSHHELLRTVAEALRGATRTARALAVAHQAIEEWPADDQVGLARMLSDTALIAGHAGSDEGAELIDRALALVEPGRDDTVRAQLLVLRARRAMLDGHTREGVEAATAAYETAAAVGSDELRSVALNLLGMSRIQRGDTGGFVEVERGRDAADGAWQGLSRYYINGSDALLTTGDWAGAVRIAEEGIVEARRHGASEGSRLMLEGNVAEARIGLGRWAEAAAWYERALPLVHESVYAVYLSERLTWLALWQGQVERAQAEARRRASSWDRFGRLEAQIRGRVAVTRAELALLRDDPAAALGHVASVVDPHEPHIPAYDLPRLAVAARAVALLGADDGPYRAALAAYAGWPTFPVWSAVVEAELGTGPWAAVAELPGPAHLRPYALLREGGRLLEAGERTAAGQALESAATEADRIGAGLVAGRARGLAERAG